MDIHIPMTIILCCRHDMRATKIYQANYGAVRASYGNAPTAKKYHHLSAEKRAYIMFTMRANPNCSARALARVLQRPPSTICRELVRLKGQSYDASGVACAADAAPCTPLYQYVHDRLVYSC